ncbi:hypothetical protein EYF80_036439 [Liparis tanakae]|uniref:Uncharacterized protein n=1 Tax=Liparis tanakae TaxID=230148 RepID=A0A4Z2GL02_9TELE|nr:hypothetical protein EYF80_036439 [Liparis tanakae]
MASAPRGAALPAGSPRSDELFLRRRRRLLGEHAPHVAVGVHDHGGPPQLVVARLPLGDRHAGGEHLVGLEVVVAPQLGRVEDLLAGRLLLPALLPGGGVLPLQPPRPLQVLLPQGALRRAQADRHLEGPHGLRGTDATGSDASVHFDTGRGVQAGGGTRRDGPPRGGIAALTFASQARPQTVDAHKGSETSTSPRLSCARPSVCQPSHHRGRNFTAISAAFTAGNTSWRRVSTYELKGVYIRGREDAAPPTSSGPDVQRDATLIQLMRKKVMKRKT